ncbi:TPA: L-histidine N(alpha)-methyltransferase [Klebsiella pneumoniae]|uniref:alpha/beta fold hydrolase n=1 Tax=Klebsiella pneumoniae TaxID=573 RepID=UPI0025C97E2F|nr:L-histidine N(alpha)-methyltransferase [Klebsiella pneumoniae]ELA2308191.1 L-histidine N(alpha)-methyltransferase [Klebsiella pneumoniae]ELT4617401.1 L-histidine N(alpha)-methyltransferase [Klebsiella pneumoniae]EME4757782.1 L-histidine N(alpha)-methyltransferase [Klebsiella pneumoniae]MDC8822543.1 L-histidine N(alpha)-methyltransferase [Klebsiella pneumoniae]
MDNLRFSSAPTADSIDASIAQHYPDCEPVAVIGYACHFPESPDGETFWQNLLEGRECSRRFTREELLAVGLDAAIIDDPHYVNIGTVLDNADCFDATLFGYSRQEAESMDPQQRLFLQAVWHALEHAGYAPGAVPHKTGVFASSRMSTYPGREALNVTEVAQVKGLQSLMGNDKDYIATRAAYKLNLHGPALSVQTACSSSLVAVHLACESLRAGESDMAVAGGVALSFPQQAGYRYQPGMIFSPDGHCRPFDASAEGTWAGNGLGCVVLRRLRDALLSGDPIISVILSSAVNNDGNRKVGYTAPSVAGQQAVIEEALMLAAIDDRQVGYIETHGTGTPLGDAIEIEALRNVYAPRPQDQRCALGSVKSNMGHLDTAAGIAGLLKTVLAVSRGQIPPLLNFHTPNPALKLEESPFTIPVSAQAWQDEMRYAGVSSFGIGGTNCHMIVASLPDALNARLPNTDSGRKSTALLLSAASDSALRRLATDYAGALRENADASSLAFTALHARRLDLPFRLAAPLNRETAEALSAWAGEKSGALVYSGHGASGKQVWLFTGQGSHWRTMGQTMYQHSTAFADTLDRCFSACSEMLTPSLREAMFNPDSAQLDNMAWAQPAIVAFEIAMAAHWRAEGLKPDFAIGHSVGEFAAAVVCGHYTIEQVMPLVCRRGALMQQCASGAMVAVFADEDTLMPLARQFELDLAANNGTQHTVFSGPEARLAVFCATLSQHDINYRRLSVTGAAHSALLEPILDRFQDACAGLHAEPGQIPIISTLTADVIDESTLNQADYWRRHMRQPVRFIQSIQVAHQLGARVFLEMGPDAQLVACGQREYRDNAYWIASARRNKEASDVLNQALLQLYAAGVALPWADLLAGDGQRIAAPCYPFDTERYWKERVSPACEPADAALSAGLEVASRAATALDLPRLEALKQCATRLHAIYVDQLVQRCTGDAIENGVDAMTIMRRGRLLPRYQQLLQRLLNNCVVDGDYRCTDGRYVRARPIEHQQRESLLTELAGYCEGFQAIPDTIARAGDRLYEMMSGAEEPVAIIFPQSASDGVEVLYQEFSFGRYFNQIAAGVLRGIVQTRQPRQPLRILEVGGGTGGTTAWLLPELNGVPALEYHFTDISALFTRRAQQKFADYDFVKYSELDLEKEAQSQGFQAQSYDLIVAANVIHATRHIGRTLDNLRPLLKPGGRLLMREITQPMRLFDFVFGPLVLPLQDLDAREGELFLTTAQWQQQCRHAGFSKVAWLPQDGSPTAGMSDETAVMAWLKKRIAVQLRLSDPASLHPNQDLLQLGMDSLLFLELSSDIQHYLGVRINAERAWQDLSPHGLTQLICSKPEATPAASQPEVLRHDADERYAPFPLTPIQHAYWLGRTHLIGYGGVACHVLFEWDKRHDEFNLAILEKAWNQLIARHDMLRMVVDADGQQRILATTPEYHIPRDDLRALSPEEQRIALEKRRHELSYRVLPADQWPLFELVVSEIDDCHYRLHMNLDLLQFDVQSFKVMMDDLAQVWRGETLAPLAITFRDYVMAEQARRQTSAWHDAWDYWQEKLPQLPLAPELPVVETPPETPHFTTFKSTIGKTEWQAVKQRWQQQGVTPSAALLTLFAATLERWSRTTTFTLNLTFFNRQPIHPQINQLIGDFTSVTLVDFNFSAPVTLQEQMQQTQQRLWQNMAHSEMNGVEVIRELGRLRGSQRQPLMPVVFTSMLGMTLEGMTIDQAMSHLFGEPCYVFTQTPQVWLDHQVMESDGELMFSWYCMDNVLEPGAAEAMFNDYCAILQAVIAAPESLKTLASGIAGHIPRRRWPLNAQADYDLRDIEQATLEYPGIRQARAEITEQGALTLDIVMADDPSPSAAMPDEHELTQLALPLPEQAQLDELEATWRWLEARALQGIAATLNRHGLFTTPEIAHRFSAIVQALSAQASHQRLLRQWLQCLTEREWLIREGESWRCRIPLSEIPEPQEACPQSQWSQALAQYLETCIARHDALFSGRCSPLELLFNEQHRVTDALYRDNPASACLNRYTAQIAALCSAERILEVGAGTAATTAPVLKATRNTRQSYHFTDVSAQFLNDARARFHDESQVSYALFDINQPLDFTAHPEAGYDLIVAVNVLHDASHVVQTLRRLKLLLKAGGRLLIVEATERNSVFQLASVGFIEGLSGYRDFRRRDEKPMLTRSAWQEVLVQAGFANELAWPAQESSPLRQHLLVARSPGVNRPDKKAVSRYLQQRFGTGLPILQIRQREALFTPLHAPSDTPTEPAKPTPVAGGNPALEKQVAELWQSLLSRPVARHHDFFELGGDSLMATRMVAQLNRRGIARANLQDLFSHSTLSDFCAHLQAATSGEDNPIPLCQGDGEETLFVFHASDGDISAWLPLASALNRRVFGLQAKSPQRFATLDQMIDEYVGCIRRQQPHGPYVLAGWSYGAFLAAGAAQRLYAKGEQVRMVLIDPVCRQDFCCENRAALLRLLAEGQTPLALPEHFDQQTPDSQLADFISLAKTAGMVSQNLTLQAAETWLDNIAHLLRLLTEHTPGESVPVPCLMVYAAGRPARWTPAETEWQGWINNADDAVIEASHWQIMMEAPHVQACAQHITRWLCATSMQPENTL